jgi:polysaccharide pyruvyl transferase WcaK-like protein
MITFYLSGHNNFGNRGCEALVRSTVALLRQRFGAVTVLVPSLDFDRDARQWPDAAAQGVEFVPASLPPAAWTQLDRFCRRVPIATRWPLFKLNPSAELRRQIGRCDALLVMGGDNYSLDYDLSSLFQYVGEAELAMSLGKVAVLWGASVGPFSRLPAIERRMVEHLNRLDLVTVRESSSLHYLHGLGVRFFMFIVAKDGTITTPSRVSLCRTIRKNFNHHTPRLDLKILTAMDKSITPKTLRNTAKPETPIFFSNQELARRTAYITIRLSTIPMRISSSP